MQSEALNTCLLTVVDCSCSVACRLDKTILPWVYWTTSQTWRSWSQWLWVHISITSLEYLPQHRASRCLSLTVAIIMGSMAGYIQYRPQNWEACYKANSITGHSHSIANQSWSRCLIKMMYCDYIVHYFWPSGGTQYQHLKVSMQVSFMSQQSATRY